MTQKPFETLDLTLLEGITTYVNNIILSDIRKAFAMGRGLQPFGIALGTEANGTKLPRPQAMAVGAFGMGLRNTKRTLKTMAKNSGATGTILMYVATVERRGMTREDEVVIVQLEHKEFGNLVWTAAIADGKLEAFTGATPIDEASHTIAKTRLMPERWMH